MSNMTGGEAGNDKDLASESSFGSSAVCYGGDSMVDIGVCLVFKLKTALKTSVVPSKLTTLLISQVARTSPA